MKRSEIKTGDVLAYQSSKYQAPVQAEVLTTRPLIATHSPTYSYRPAPLNAITLEDGTVVQAPAREPYQHSRAADKGLLVRVTRQDWSGDGTKPDRVDLEVVRLADLKGPYAAVMAQREADKQARLAAEQRQQEVMAARQEEFVALRERYQAVLARPAYLSDTRHQVALSREDFAALLDLAEATDTRVRALVNAHTAISSVDHEEN